MTDPFAAILGVGRGPTVRDRLALDAAERWWEWPSEQHPELSTWLADRVAAGFTHLTVRDTSRLAEWRLEVADELGRQDSGRSTPRRWTGYSTTGR